MRLITPLFGGGVKTRVSDPGFPIRPTAIRGQLQFWWRATVGAQYTSVEELRAAHGAVWGDTTHASPVRIRVELEKERPDPSVSRGGASSRPNLPGADRALSNRKESFDGPDYALFPFQGTGREAKGAINPDSYVRAASFRLTVTWSKEIDFAKQVEPAIWAWVNFGGLGSRTRRGCGALFCEPLAPVDVEDLVDEWERLMPQLFPTRRWSTLAERLYVGTLEPSDDPMEVWREVIKTFRKFRQGEGLGRNRGKSGPNRPGRSRFPEPETIRRVTGQRAPLHQRLEHIPDDAFPRAEFGLPIIFHFKDKTDPSDTALYPVDPDGMDGKKWERMSSPLILKPLALKNGKVISVILWLQTPPLTRVDLRRGDRSLELPSTTVVRADRLSVGESPLRYAANGSAIEAFLSFACESGEFEEVKI